MGINELKKRIAETEAEIQKLISKFCGNTIRHNGRFKICGERKYKKTAICNRCEKKYGDDLEQLCAYLDGLEFGLKHSQSKIESQKNNKPNI